MSKPTILIHTYNYGYYKRMFWQLSSLLDQVAYNEFEAPYIKYVCSVHKDDPYIEWMDIIKEVFANKIDLHFDVWDDTNIFSRRGWVRSKWLKECDKEWLIFNDSDMVYDPQYFAHLSTYFPIHKGKTPVIGVPRFTMTEQDGYGLIASAQYDAPIKDSAAKCQALSPTMSNGGNVCGAGYFQCVDAKAVQALGINYVDGRCDTSVFGGTYKTVSDKAFRYKVKGYVKFRQAKPSYHINHHRKGDAGVDPVRPILH